MVLVHQVVSFKVMLVVVLMVVPQLVSFRVVLVVLEVVPQLVLFRVVLVVVVVVVPQLTSVIQSGVGGVGGGTPIDVIQIVGGVIRLIARSIDSTCSYRTRTYLYLNIILIM